jgi:hypothetical protein
MKPHGSGGPIDDRRRGMHEAIARKKTAADIRGGLKSTYRGNQET